MKTLAMSCLLALCAANAAAQGFPYMRNFKATDYHANSYNFDIEIGRDGTVFVANFEGVLYYDKADWRIIPTPGIQRVTVVFRGGNDVIWVGGNNYFGQIVVKPNGDLALERKGRADLFTGEVVEIWEKAGIVYFLASNNVIYRVEGDDVVVEKRLGDGPLKLGLSAIMQPDSLENEQKAVVMDGITQTEKLDNGLVAIVSKNEGIIIATAGGEELCTLTEAHGLVSNAVDYIGYDGHGTLWAATENGVSAIAVPSAFSHFTATEGLPGEVLCISDYEGHVYAGTTKGLFRLDGMAFVGIAGINHACWDLSVGDNGLMAATVGGIWSISASGDARQLSQGSAMSIMADGPRFYSGEMDGLYLQGQGVTRHKVCDLEKVTKILRDADGTLWLQNMYGAVWHQQRGDARFAPYKKDNGDEAATIVPVNGKVAVVGSAATHPFPYPLYSFAGSDGITWLTNGDGKALYRWKDGQRTGDLDRLILPLGDMSVRALYQKQNQVWLGGTGGIVVIDTGRSDAALNTEPRLRFRSITLGGDSIIWGGYSDMPTRLPRLDYYQHSLRFTYALDYTPLVGKTLYRYRLNDGAWSTWEADNDVELNLSSGFYTLEVQARLATGFVSDPISIDFSIAYPFYFRWYMLALYLLLFLLAAYALMRYRLHRLKVEKQRLENIVRERTAEVVKQKDEIEEKSKSLETALHDLHAAQHELIRQEKMATVGKLTQGLIDRILNPLNYINNFSKLSEGLVHDIEANIEDERDSMDPDNYEDTRDVLGMLSTNLKKVGEHGQNTTRTLKAMEEMLRDRSGNIVDMDVAAVLRQNVKMLNTYYADDISRYGIRTEADIPDGTISIKGNAEQLSKTFMSLVANAVYAVVKKASRQAYSPEVAIRAKVADGHVAITFSDNGIGIESAIIDKVFDPFFTTKTTGEAAGVGLYLSHETVQNHGGTISVKSEKNVYTEFTVILPTT